MTTKNHEPVTLKEALDALSAVASWADPGFAWPPIGTAHDDIERAYDVLLRAEADGWTAP